jgi:hypothetical protein
MCCSTSCTMYVAEQHIGGRTEVYLVHGFVYQVLHTELLWIALCTAAMHPHVSLAWQLEGSTSAPNMYVCVLMFSTLRPLLLLCCCSQLS